MERYCEYDLTSDTGSCYLEFCVGRKDAWSKFENQGSLFVSDNAFLVLGIDSVFCRVVPEFDFCGDTTIVTKTQWQEIYRLSLVLDSESKQVFEEINTWVVNELRDYNCFSVIGV